MDDAGWTEGDLERELRAFGPLMLRQERLEAETPDPMFARGLRASLAGTEAMPTRAPVQAPRVATGAPSVGTRLRPARLWRRRPALWIGVAAAACAALFASGGPRHAWAALRQLLYYVPIVGTGQVEPAALVADRPVSASDGAVTLTVTGVVAGRHATLVSYGARGASLASGGASASVADALDATLGDAAGHGAAPLSWVPARRGADHGVPAIHGLMIFPALPRGARTAYLRVARLPYTPLSRGWTLALPLHPVTGGGARSSQPIDQGVTVRGIRLTATDLTRTGDATVVDLSATIQGGPYSGGAIVSLAPEQAIGSYAPVLSSGRASYDAARAVLPATVRSRVLPQPEFVYPPVPHRAEPLSLTVPAVAVRRQDRATLTVPVGAGRRTAPLGQTTLILTSTVVTPPAALGLDNTRHTRLAIGFPAASSDATLQSVDVVVDGVSQTVSRDDPTVDLPLTSGQRAVHVVIENPVVAVNGPWTVTLAP